MTDYQITIRGGEIRLTSDGGSAGRTWVLLDRQIFHCGCPSRWGVCSGAHPDEDFVLAEESEIPERVRALLLAASLPSRISSLP